MADIETTPHGEPRVTPGLEPVVVKETDRNKKFNPAWRGLVIPLLAGAVIFLAGLLVGLAIPTHGHGDFNGPGHGKDSSYVFQEGERSFGNRGDRPNGPAERGERSETEVGPSVQGPQDNSSTDDRTDENDDDNVDPSEQTRPSVESE